MWILYAGCAQGRQERFLSHHQGQSGATTLVISDDDAIPLTRSSILSLIQVVHLHPSCNLETQPEWVLFNEFVLTTRPFIRTVTEIRPEWLIELAANYYDLATFIDGETKRSLRRVLQKRRRTGKQADLDAAMLKMNSMKIS